MREMIAPGKLILAMYAIIKSVISKERMKLRDEGPVRNDTASVQKVFSRCKHTRHLWFHGCTGGIPLVHPRSILS